MGTARSCAIIASLTVLSVGTSVALGCSATSGGSSSDELNEDAHQPGAGGAGGEGSLGMGASGNGAPGTGGACEAVNKVADNKIQPSDIILAIDQSGSMDQETQWVTNQLNGFAQQIMNSGIDVRVIVIAGKPNSENGFCVPAPLSSGGCPDDNNLPTFLHVDQHVDSHDAFARILGRFGDYQSLLRFDASQHVVVITDDDSNMGAGAFDAAFQALDPMLADYVFHAIACADDGGPCADDGDQYWALVQSRGGHFGELSLQNFQPIWDVLTTQVVQNATLACEWDIPAPPDGQQFAPDMVNVQFAVNGGAPELLGRVDSAADCGSVSGGWYYDDPAAPTKIMVCPDVCQVIQGADSAEVNIEFGCQTLAASPV